MSTYLIGDIQGCLDPLERLLDKVRFDPASDRLWPCGDLVNRGGHSLEVLRLLYSVAPQVSVTLGNHDLHLLAAAERFPEGGSGHAEFEAVLTAHDRDGLLRWLRAQPLATFSESHHLLRVHAGVPPSWTWQQAVSLGEEVSRTLASADRAVFLRKMYGNRPRAWKNQTGRWKRLRVITNMLTRLRFCDARGRANFRLNGGPNTGKGSMKPWYRHKHRQTRSVRVAFGHWAALGFRLKKRFVALDSGCVWGGHLTAYRIEDGEIFQVDGIY